MQHHLELTRVEPHAVPGAAHVDLQVPERALLERLLTARASGPFFGLLLGGAFGVEHIPALAKPLGILPRKVFVFILTRLSLLPHAKLLDGFSTELAR
jgi:hypothetical protein